LPTSHAGREILTGSDNSLQQDMPSSPEGVIRNRKRNKDEGNLDPSWMLQQSHESAPDVTHVIYGRKAIRIRDGLMHDDVRDLSTQRQNVARGSGLLDAWVTDDEHPDPRLESYRLRFNDQEDRRARASGSETSGSGAQHPTSRRAPSPYVRYEGRNRNNADANPDKDSQETLGRNFFGANYAPASQAPQQKRPDQTQDPPPRAIVRDRVAAREGQKFKETDPERQPATFNIGGGDAKNSGDRNDWYQEKKTRDINRASWKSQVQKRYSQRSGTSQNLDGLKKERDLAVAKHTLEKAEREEIEAELQIAELDVAVVLERRSRNSSRASSARARDPSEASGSHRRSTTGRERSLRRSLEEVLEAPEDLAIGALQDSHVTTPYYSAMGSSLNDLQ
jgi:hypothetical protein